MAVAYRRGSSSSVTRKRSRLAGGGVLTSNIVLKMATHRQQASLGKDSSRGRAGGLAGSMAKR